MSEPQPRSEHWAPNPDPTSIVIPGVDVTASVNGQIDQIDQLITIRLQNIDANFSRIQHIISTKLLPAFKRYAEGTEPVREAAKFWKSFYEAAAQVRIPIANDTSSLYHTEDDNSERDTTAESDNEDRTPINVNPQDDSFARGAPISSTPLVRDPTNVALPRDTEDDDSWAASIESPFERLGREVKDLTLGGNEPNPEDPSSSEAPSFSPMHGTYPDTLPRSRPSRAVDPPIPSEPTPKFPHSRRKGKSPLRQNVLRQNAAAAAASDSMSTPPRSLHTPRRVKTPRNPFFPPNSASRKWNGLVDLRNPSPAKSKSLRGPRTPEQSTSNNVSYDSDSSDDLFPPGMSPPITMQFAMPSRLQRSVGKVALTPARRAAERIGRDLVVNAAHRGMESGSTKRSFDSAGAREGDPSMSSVAPSLPSLTRYSGRPTRAHTLAATSSLEPPRLQGEGDTITPVHQIYRPYAGPEAFAQVSDPRYAEEGSGVPKQDPRRLIVDEGTVPSPASDSDSESSEHDESNPSAAFIFATQNNARAHANDSFASSQQSMSSDEEEDDAARAARHPLAHIFVTDGDQGGAVDDSFDQDDSFEEAPAEEETVFGARQVGQAPGEARLRIMRDALIDDTYPGAPSLNPFAQVENSPTPYVGDGQEFQ